MYQATELYHLNHHIFVEMYRSQLDIVSSLKLNETTYDSASVINHEQYCECGSISITAVGCDLNEPRGPVIVRRQSERE